MCCVTSCQPCNGVLHALQKSFEEIQAAVQARKQAAANSSLSSSADGAGADNSAGEQQQETAGVYHIRSSWADGMRGRFVPAEAGDPTVPDRESSPAGANAVS